MGKQKGEGGRSKNRPSSSSLAASLLPTGASTVGFGGFLGSSRIETPASSSEESTSTFFSDVDGEVAQHLKRLGRKDPTTKLKALSKLCLLFKQKSGDEIAEIIPQWAFEYKRLLLDYNREVRRATHDAMSTLVTTVRRGLAPHLKSLMGPWWFSQFDPIPEVSQAAKRSLEAAFPAPERRLDSMMLCVNEIFLYLDENLKLLPQTMSDKSTPMDELEDMHQRVISSSLLAVATLVDILLGMKLHSHDSENLTAEQKLASKARTTTVSAAEKLFSTHKFFLDFLKSKSPVIRSATYFILTSFIKHIPHAYNEGNMKMLSAAILGAFQEKDVSCHSSMWDMLLLFSREFPDSWSSKNIQKVALSRFWQFLRNGCYGSQQISYPALVLFLESIPPKEVVGEQFILEFFQNLWAGRDPLHSSATVNLAFFKAFKECFLWAMSNTSRYCSVEDAINSLHVKLIDHILVRLLWQDYLLLGSSKGQDENLLQGSDCSAEASQTLHERQMEKHSTYYPISYVQELGKCIVEILIDISDKKFSLISTFCASFQNDCLAVFQQGELLPRFREQLQWIVSFFRLLDQFALQKGQTWPLHSLAGPLIAKSFAVIKSTDSSDAIKFLPLLIEIFGPATIFSYLPICNEGHDMINTIPSGDSEGNINHFLHIFRDDIVPWCLQGHTRTSSAKLDLLIASIQDEYFSDQWCSIITYATNLYKCSENENGTSDVANQILVLTMLIEKVREKIRSMKIKNVQGTGSLPEHWQHELLDSTAVSIALRSPPSDSHAQFLRAALGGSHEEDQLCFLSREAVITIFDEILKRLVSLLSTSSFDWARLSCSSLPSCGLKEETQHPSSFADKLKMAQFAFEVLEGSIFCLTMLGEDLILLPCILAVTFIIDWECSMESYLGERGCSESCEQRIDSDVSLLASRNVLNNHLHEQLTVKLTLGNKMHGFCQTIGASFLRCLSSSSLSRLRSILVQTVRSSVFEKSNLSANEISSLCCKWVLDLLEVVCHDQTELQNILDLLLAESNAWPHWVVPLNRDGMRLAAVQDETVRMDVNEQRHHQFVAFANKLISSLGVCKVIAGLVPQSSSSLTEASIEQIPPFSFSYSRAWLAAELLCTWKWQGGSAADSFLPSLRKYSKNETSFPKLSVTFSIVDILFNGSLTHGTNNQWIYFDAWVASNDEVENIEDPYLRALTALLLVLFVKDNVWRQHEAVVVFKLVIDKIFLATSVNRTCLRILPFVLSVIIQPLLFQSIEFDEASTDVLLAPGKDDLVLKNMLKWLQTALSFPPLGIRTAREQDLIEWIQVVISCYPLRAVGELDALKVEVPRDIDHLERNLLLSLFRKQRYSVNDSNTPDEMSSASSNWTFVSSMPEQMALAKLTAISVGYCWQEFSDADWDFVLDNLHKWIESSVLLLEEMVERIDDVVMTYTAANNSELTLQKLEAIVQASDRMQMGVTSTALLILCLLSQLVEIQGADDVEVLQLIRVGKWAQIKDRIMENILRLFFSTGAAEAIAASCSVEASSIVASGRRAHSQFWGRVASFVVTSPDHVRTAAVKSMELWGLSKGSISSLYALLFSSDPVSSLQFASYRLLSTNPICQLSLFKEIYQEGIVNASQESDLVNDLESTSEMSPCLMDEISSLIQKPTAELLEMDLVSQDRVNVFRAWAILLSHLHSLSPSSPERERLIQYVQESASSTILDCIFQHIPLKLGANNLKKKDFELVGEASMTAKAAKHVITSCSILLNMETICPVGTEQIASLAGSVYGMMIRFLPSYVSNWFNSLRDHFMSSAVESFTKTWCSPPLLSDELSQVKETIVADENFSVSVSKSAYEITAMYKKEEAGMDLVIRLPSCYPVRPVDVDCTRSFGISEQKKRKWLLALLAFLRNQNGTIADAIKIWRSNIDKQFVGVEECPICYSIIHTTNHSVPKLACKTCKHKFHSACLYKWFSTSHKSTCPLCQTPF